MLVAIPHRRRGEAKEKAKHSQFDVTKDYYGVLCLAGNISAINAEAIQTAYYEKSLLLHPDKSRSTTTEAAFKAIEDACRVLGDIQLRALYDDNRVRSMLQGLYRTSCETKIAEL